VFVQRFESLQNFRGVKELKKPIEFTKVNILIGPNNAGKTTILDILSLLLHPDIAPAPGSGYYSSRREFLTNLRGGIRRLVYRYGGEACAVIEYVYGHSFRVNITVNAETGTVDCDITRYELLEKLGVRDEGELARLVIYVPSDTTFLKQLYNNLSTKDFWNSIHSKGLHTRCAKFVQEITGHKYLFLIHTSDELSIVKEINHDYIITRLVDLGTGIFRATMMLLWFSYVRPRLVLIDDFEFAFHPTLTKAFIKFLVKELDTQVILATHSIDVLESLIELYEDDVLDSKDCKIIHLTKDEEDKLYHTEYCIDKMYGMVRSGHDPRRVAIELGL